MTERTIQQIENYARQMMTAEIAHDFKHADRVRNWALRIAREEGLEDIELVQVAALLHDIGLGHSEKRSLHGQIGAQMAERFLRENELLPEEKIGEVVNAIRYHNSARDGTGQLLSLLRDADIMDMLGAVGIMRAFTSKASVPEYDPENVKGEMWGISARDVDERFEKELGFGEYIIDQINFQISCYGNLSTETAKRLAKPLVEYMRDYVGRLESEITQGRESPSLG